VPAPDSRHPRTRGLGDGAAGGAALVAAAGAEGDKSEFQVNGTPFWKAKPLLASLGERQIWTVRNERKFAHPSHLHGFGAGGGRSMQRRKSPPWTVSPDPQAPACRDG
jgi:FtsP/CotA-like multicopper oxidase with cupredoxin domain